MVQRDAEATKQSILDAVGRVLERDGFSGLGINAIAKEAGVGKPLIYRYFGGLQELLDEFGRDADFWMRLDDILVEADKETGGVPPASFAEVIRTAMICYTRVLRRSPVMQEILASELTATPDLIKPLAEARRETGVQALEEYMDGIEPPEGVDVDAIYGILLAAFQYLTVRGRVDDGFWGIPLGTDEEWKRFEDAMGFIIHRVFSGEGRVKPG